MSGAAFFDLDRTLLAGASGEVFSRAMTDAGITSGPFPGEKFLFGLFNRIGETLPSMLIARQGVALAAGRSQSDVRAAAETVADDLVDMLQPFAETVFEAHREAGRPIVLATTTPEDLVGPFAERLGLDGVVATRYAVGSDGRYTGELDGPFVWSAGKLAAIQTWASEHGIALEDSWAYSDSFYDAPMLGAVGNPIVVNPDPRLVLLAAARRWPTMNLDVSPGVVKIPVVGLEVQELALRFNRSAAYPYARFSFQHIDRIPTEWPAILVGNHRSYFDVSAMSLAIAKAGRPARFLGKKEVFDAPIVGPLATAMGGIRVDRASGSDEPLQAAADALAGGEMVAMMPEGTIPRGPAFFDP
ncbi:MAG: HAD-IB family hydrolase, partial [Actinomycetota bacterium]